jgi:phospholipid/cholesterol/gamma-HCH transport system substrate-binding protein
MVVNRSDHSLAVLGACVSVAVVVFTLLFVAATNRSLTERRSHLWVVLPTAEGLRKGDAVLYRGVQVGEVRRIDFAADGAIAVRALLTRTVPLTSTASARVVAADVFGRQSVVLDAGAGGRLLAAGDTLRGTPPVSLTARIEGMAGRLERMVGDTTAGALHALLAETAAAAAAMGDAVRATSHAIALQQQPLESALTHGAGVAANLRAATDSTALIALRAAALIAMERLDGITLRVDSASVMLARSLARIDAGQGSLGLLAADPALYQRAVGTLDELEALIADVRRNPKRYINVSIF